MGEVKKLGLDCVYHLFFDREIFINEIFEAAPIAIPTKQLNLDTLVRVNIIELEGQPLPFDLFIYLPSNKKTILYRPQGQVLDEKTIEKFKKYRHYNLYIRKSDLGIYKEHSAKVLADIQADPAVPLGVRNRKVAGEIKKLMTGFFTDQDFSSEEGKQLVDNAGRVVEEYIKETCKDKKMLEAVEAIAGEHMTNYTHSRNVATYCTLFGMSQGYGTPEELHMGGLLHDIGMSDLPEEMLWKSEEDMDERELGQYKLHPGNARLELTTRKVKVTESVLNMVVQHHERPDGSGFPYGLKADEIDPLAKICAFADEFDRLTSVREGQKQFTPVGAIDRISGNDGKPAEPFYEEEFHAQLVNDFADEKPFSLEVPEIGQAEVADMPEEIPELAEFPDSLPKKGPKVPVFETADEPKKEASKEGDYIGGLLDNMVEDFQSLLNGDDSKINFPGSTPEQDANPDMASKNKELFEAAKVGDVLALQVSIDEGADINAQDENGNTALMLAVENGQDEAAKHLMEEGADVEAFNDLNKTAIDIAESTKQKALLGSLEKFKNQNQDKDKEKNQDKNKTSEFDVNRRNKQGQTILMQLAVKGNVEGAQKVINMGANVKGKDFKGHTALIFAANKGHVDIVKLLVDKGANLDVKDGSGRTALVHAIEHKHTEVVSELLNKGARPDFRLKGLTMLMIAAYTGQQEVVQLLLDYGAGVKDKDIKGKTAIEYALVKGHMEIAELINGGPLKKSS